MKIKITKPPISLIWLDTWFVLDLTKAIKGEKSQIGKDNADKIIHKITALTHRKKLICPEGDQGIEIENGERLIEEARRLQAQVSQGISLQFHAGVEDMQIQRMMKGVIERSKVVKFPWEDIFSEDPVKQIDRKDPFIISVNFNPTPAELKKRQEINKSIAKDWETLRIQSLRSKENYHSRLEREFNGKAEAIEHVMVALAAKALRGKQISIDDMRRAAAIAGKPVSWWENYSGKKDDWQAVLSFYKSPEYQLIPSINVGTRLLTDLVNGNEAISPSDVMDIHHIATILPYASYMVVDKRIRSRIEGKRTELSRDYQCVLVKWQEVLPLLERLEKS